jgi:transcription termination factor Rho
MSVLTRSSLEGSPLADLHELASELELDGFRRLRKADLVDRILEVHGGDTSPAPDAEPEPEPEPDAEAEATEAPA